MKLQKFQKKLNESQLSKDDRKKMEDLKNKINDFIRDENLDELDVEGNEFLQYSKKVKDKIDELLESMNCDDIENVRDQLYRFYDIK
jgi:hypothetical protein